MPSSWPQLVIHLRVVLAALLATCSPHASLRAVAPAATAEDEPQAPLQTLRLTITSASGVRRFIVEVAETSEQQRIGMMFRKSLAPDRGMLFPQNPPQNVAFWMKNTLIPLDLVFIRADKTIARISTGVPRSETKVPSGEPVAAVLEIAGGRAAELGIRAGDKVKW
jgi:uncharacterized membrane protein (UPF0127 family)